MWGSNREPGAFFSVFWRCDHAMCGGRREFVVGRRSSGSGSRVCGCGSACGSGGRRVFRSGWRFCGGGSRGRGLGSAHGSGGRRFRGVGGTSPRVGGVTAMREARGRIWQYSSTKWEAPVPGWEPSVRGQGAGAGEWEAQVSKWEAGTVAVGGATRHGGRRECGRKLGGCSCVHPRRTMLNCIQRNEYDLGFLYLCRSRLSCCLP